VQLLCKNLSDSGPIDLTNVRLAGPADEAAIREIARESFIHDRFHADSNIPRSIADAVKEQWVANYFHGKRGNALFVLEERGSILGFLLAIKQTSKGFNIDLIGIAKAHRGKHFGEVLITFAQAYFSAEEYSTEIRVGTQVSNLSSLRLYQRIGFSVIGTNYMLHYNSN
jgi:ribosomal protein S18 acetylase RimI-like enzyme